MAIRSRSQSSSPITSWGQRHGRYHSEILPGFNLASCRRLLDRFEDMIPSTSVGAAISALPATRFSQDNTDMHKHKPPTWLNTTSLDMLPLGHHSSRMTNARSPSPAKHVRRGAHTHPKIGNSWIRRPVPPIRPMAVIHCGRRTSTTRQPCFFFFFFFGSPTHNPSIVKWQGCWP